MREDVVPFVVSGIFLSSCVLLVAAYGIWRKFVVKKTDFDVFDPNAKTDQDRGDNVEMMTTGNGSFDNGYDDEEPQEQLQQQTVITSEPEVKPKPAAASNPFKNKAGAASNPFNQQGYGAAAP